MAALVTKYTRTKPFGSVRHDWTVVGRHGAIHLHISEPPPPVGEHRYEASAGLEVHYRQPPSYMEDSAPSHERCWVFEGGSPCWHDGTTSYAMGRYLPLWQLDPHDHEGMFGRLEAEYRDRFARRCEPVEAE